LSQENVNGSNWLKAIQDNFTELYAATLTTPPATDVQAEALSATDKALTPANFAALLGKIDIITFSGHNLAGACTVTGVHANDLVVSVTGLAAGTEGDKSTSFESVVTVNDQIQQSAAADLSANIYIALIFRMS
jgi:hypothetical protein